MMLVFQIAIIIFLFFVLIVVYQDEHKRRKLARKTAVSNNIWEGGADKESGKERRQHVRVDTQLNVLYEVDSTRQASPKKESVSKNISAGGLNLSLTEKLSAGTIISLQFNLPENKKPLTVQGKVVWVKEMPQSLNESTHERFFSTGIQFVKMDSGDAGRLKRYINKTIQTTQGGCCQ